MPLLSEGDHPTCTKRSEGMLGKPSKARRLGLVPRQGEVPLSRDKDRHRMAEIIGEAESYGQRLEPVRLSDRQFSIKYG